MLWDDAQSRPGEKIKLRPDDEIRRVVLCSGKVYYDLYEAREAAGIDDVYLLRVEQLYPFPARALMHELSRFPQGRGRLVPGGADEHGRLDVHRAQHRVGARAHADGEAQRAALRRARRPSAATATGLASKHNQEQKALVTTLEAAALAS